MLFHAAHFLIELLTVMTLLSPSLHSTKTKLSRSVYQLSLGYDYL